MPDVLIALGSNLGDRLANLRAGVSRLGELVKLTGASAIYETAPMYVTDQPAFLNAAVRGTTGLSPREMLRELKAIEAEIGRHDGRRYGPREIDLDLVGYGAMAYRYSDGDGVRLVVPHPRTPERRFVLQPLADVAREFVLPGLGRVDRLLAQTERQSDTVQPIQDALLQL